MKKVILTNETLQEVLSRVTTMTDGDNKVRVTIGQKDTGNGLACWAAIVNGGAMLKTAFRTVAPKTPVELEKDKPYFEFICKAKDLVTNAGALLTYKADVTLTDDEGKVFFSVASGSKVPVGKVSAETAEPLLHEDYDQRYLVFQGEKAVATLEKGGISSTMDQGTAVTSRIEDGQLVAISGARTNYSLYACPVIAQYLNNDAKAAEKAEEAKTADAPATEAPAKAEVEITEEVAKDAKIYLTRYFKNLPEEEQSDFGSRVSTVKDDIKALVALAQEVGWKAPGQDDAEENSEEKSEEKKPEEAQPVAAAQDPVFFTLSSVNWKLLTKLFSGSAKAVFMVTPKNVHVNDPERHLRATFALNDSAKSFFDMVERTNGYNRGIKCVVDRDALSVALNVMKLGDPNNSFRVTASSKGLLFKKEGEDFTSSVALLKSEGDLSLLKHNYGAASLASLLSTLKAGNALLEFSDNFRVPMRMSNGDLENEGSGWCGLTAIDVEKARAEAAAKAKAEAGKKAKAEAEKKSAKADDAEETAEE